MIRDAADNFVAYEVAYQIALLDHRRIGNEHTAIELQKALRDFEEAKRELNEAR